MRIAIIGAGPAGSMAALRLARAGARVTIFDPSHPREKPCGGGLTGRALSLVADAIDIGALSPVVIDTAVVQSADRDAHVPLIDRGATPASSLVVVSRAVFDRAVADAAVAAGAELICRRASDVRRHDDRFRVRVNGADFDADFVIGADGANSIVRRKFSAPFSRAQVSVAAGFFARGVRSSAIAIKTTCEHPGYLWSFPRADHLAVGVCAPATHRVSSVQLRARSAEWIERFGPGRRAELTPYAWPIPSIGYNSPSRATFGGPGWMLAGDAAGLVDPLTREGIYYALLSGQWVAAALAGHGPDCAAAVYASWIRRDIEPEFVRAARLSRLFFAPAFNAVLVRALDESAAIRRVFADLVAGVQPYRGLRRRLLATRQWSLAIRMALGPGFAGTMKTVALPARQ